MIGKVCIITGGGSGIGAALCRSCDSAGAAAVVVVDMNRESAAAVAASLACKTLSLSANCGVEMDIRRVITTAWATFGTASACHACLPHR